MDYGWGAKPDNSDPFPKVNISTQFDGLDKSLFKSSRTLSLPSANKKAQYKECVKVLNKKWLCVD